jgi:isopenicillin-N N-acyltransferase like protein
MCVTLVSRGRATPRWRTGSKGLNTEMSAAASDDAATPPEGGGRPAAPATVDGDPFGGRLLDLSGDGATRGAAHGEEFRGLIGEALERWRDRIGTRSGGDPGGYVHDFLDRTDYAGTVARLSPDLHQEVLAIAAASGHPVAELLAYNFMDEEWRFDRDVLTGCSVIGVVARAGGAVGETVVLGQNMDLPTSMTGSQVVLRIAGDGERPERIVLTAAGMIGLLGVNAAGVAVCVNTLNSLPAADSGMPVAFIVRRVLDHRDAATAGRYLTSIDHASGQHYAIADGSGVHGYECCADGCAAGPAGSALAHTNHPLWWPDGSGSGDDPEGHAVTSTTYRRLASLEAGVRGVRVSGDLRPLLSSTEGGVCVVETPERRAATFCSAEFTLTSPPSVRVALGAPNTTAWHPIGWTGATV